MSATRDFMLDELGDPDAPIGSKLWALWLHNEIRKTYYDKQQKGDLLRVLIDMAHKYQSWQEFGYLTWEDFCIERLHVKADDIDTEARARVAAVAEAAKPLPSHGAIGNGRKSRDYNYNLYSDDSRSRVEGQAPDNQGTSPEYLTARIARDRPDILEKMKAGEYSSVRSAAIDAGIVDPGKAPYQLPKDPKKAGVYLAKRVDTEWFILMADEFYKQMEVAKLPA